jgi:hypothetical protein
VGFTVLKGFPCAQIVAFDDMKSAKSNSFFIVNIFFE